MITAKSQPFTPAYPWGTRTGTAAKATSYRTKMRFVKDKFTVSYKFPLCADRSENRQADSSGLGADADVCALL